MKESAHQGKYGFILHHFSALFCSGYNRHSCEAFHETSTDQFGHPHVDILV